MALQIRRGTDAERQSITPKEGELIYAIDTNRLWVGGKIAPSQSLEPGGILVSGSLVNDTNPTLASDMNLNGHNITGTGNINIDGTITATGTVNLGDGVEDNVVVGGQIGSSLIPGAAGAFDLGTDTSTWRTVYTRDIDVETSVTAGDVYIKGSIGKDDSTIIYDGATGALAVGAITATGTITATGDITTNGALSAASLTVGAISGDVVGSVFGDDSTTLVDGVNNVLSTGDLTIQEDRLFGTQVTSGYDNILNGLEKVVIIGSISDPGALLVEGSENPINVKGVANATVGTSVTIEAARYTNGTRDVVQNGDVLGQWVVSGYNGIEARKAGIIQTSVESVPDGSGNFASRMQVGVLQETGLYSQFGFESDGRFSCIANTYTPLPDAVIGTLVVPEGSVGYGTDKDALVVYDGVNFKTVPTFVGVPSGPTATGKQGQVSADADYMYICHSDDNWIRVAKDGTW